MEYEQKVRTRFASLFVGHLRERQKTTRGRSRFGARDLCCNIIAALHNNNLLQTEDQLYL